MFFGYRLYDWNVIIECMKINAKGITWDSVIFLVFLVAAGLRLWHLGFRDLWYDEALSLQIRGMFFEEQSASYLAHHPPLYFIFIDLWVRFFGSSEFSIRFPSFILACVPCGYYSC